MSRITISILTEEETRHGDAPLICHIDNTAKGLGSDSGIIQSEDAFVLGRVGAPEAVLFTKQEARELVKFLQQALKG